MKAIVTNAEDPLDPASDSARQSRIDDIVEAGPSGAFAVAGVAVGIVVALWLAFYVFVYLPRGAVQ